MEAKSRDEIVYKAKKAIDRRRANNIEEDSIAKFIDTYLELNGLRTQNSNLISRIAYTIRIQADFVTIKSVSKAFIDWGIENHPIQINMESTQSIEKYALGMLTFPNELIIVLAVDDESILYLSSNGSVKRSGWLDLSSRWTGIFLISKLPPISRIQFNRKKPTSLNLLKDYDYLSAKLIAIISKGIKDTDGKFNHILLAITSPIVYYLYKIKFNPLYITSIWTLSRYTAAILLFFDQTLIFRIASIFLISLSHILEVCQGTLSRFSMQDSNLDSYLNKLCNLTSRLILIAGISVGLYRQVNSNILLLWGGACILSDVIFETIWENQSKMLAESRAGIVKLINQFYPLNSNIFIIGLILNTLSFIIIFWTILAFILSIWMAVTELILLSRSSRARSDIYSAYMKAFDVTVPAHSDSHNT